MNRRLLRQARTYVAHGWRVAPGAFWTSRRRYQCPVPGCLVAGLHPTDHPASALVDSVAVDRVAVADEIGVEAVWGSLPYSLLLPTGPTTGIDVLQVPVRAMRLPPPPSLRAPVAVLDADGTRYWMVFARHGDPVAESESVRQVAGAVVHQDGSWVPIPPSPVRGTLAWLREPQRSGWELPTLNVALAAVDNRLFRNRVEVIPAPRGRADARRARRALKRS